ncbi:MAG: Gldg family protein, partial [Pseudomonadota bacterium]
VFMPALAMRLWAEERAAGADELLLSLPLSLTGLVAGKLLAAWTVAAAALALTVPMWLTANYLGSPDNAAIALSYAVSLFMAGAYLAIGAAVSAASRSQVTAFVLSVVAAFLVTAAGWPLVLSGVTDAFGQNVANGVARFSFLTHFDAAQRGVLELRSILYFASLIVLCGYLNGLFAASRRRSRVGLGRRFAPLAALSAVAIFATSNALIQPRLASARADFTENRLFTLSAGTREVLSDIVEPIDLVFAYTPRTGQAFPSISAYAARVRELLDAYESLSGGAIRVREIDPRPVSSAEDEALAAGIEAVRGNGPDPVYFGLIGVNAVDDQLVIPFLAPDRETTLEYDLTRMIARLNNPEPPVVAVISSLQGMSGDGKDAGYFVLQEMAKSYTIRPLAPTFVSIPKDVDILFAAHAAELTNRQWDLIDQFVLRQGRALFAIDPAAKAALGGGLLNAGPRIIRSDLGPLGRHWGVRLDQRALADAANALPVEAVTEDGRVAVVGQPLFFAAPPSALSDDDPVSSALGRPVHFGAPGALVVEPVAGIDVDVLMTTGEAPSFMDADFAASRASPREVISLYDAEPAAEPLMVRLSGEFSTAFPDGPPAPDNDDPVTAELARAAAEAEPPRLQISNGVVQILVIADADVLDDGFYLNPNNRSTLADNAALVLNALDNLAGGADLVGLRSRAPSLRPMTRVERLRQAAEARYFDEQSQLQAELAQATARLDELRRIGSASGFFSGDLDADLDEAQRAELIALRDNVTAARERLRDIERDFRSEIDGLEATLKILNIWGGPILVGLIAGLVWLRRRRGGV